MQEHSGLQLLKETRVHTLLPKDDIVCFSKNEPLTNVFKGLVENRILSAPVFDPIRHTHTGFVDLVDIVAFFVTGLKGGDETCELEAAKAFSSEKCAAVCDLSGRNPFCPVEGMAPLLSAIHMMAKWRVHRIPVIDSEGELITILTQSHVVKFLYLNMSIFSHLSMGTVENLHMMRSPVVSISSEQIALEAFITVHEKKVSGVGVVDETGKLVGNISASDLKLIGFDGTHSSRLYYSASQFLKLLAKERDALVEPPIYVTLQSTFSDVVAKLVNCSVHRVYVVDTAFHPIAVITPLEVLKVLLDFLHNI